MRWLADECVHSDVVRNLRIAGHDVIYAAEVLQEAVDAQLADEALQSGRVLITEDKDFGELAFQKLRAVPGIVLLRIPQEQRSLKSQRLLETIKQYGDILHDSFTVIEKRRVRQRALPARG